MGNLNYFTLTVLMTVESSFIPFPSEVVVPPAAWKAAQGEMSLFWVIFFSTLGALLGALINYFLSISLGRLVIYKLADTRLAHFFLINSSKIEKAEVYFRKHGNASTLIGRLVPVIRQLISIPAGLSKMKLGPFILYTSIGAAIWNVILALIGYFLYSQKELLDKYYNELSIVLVVLGCLFVAYLVYNGLKSKKKGKAEENKSLQ
ncbi:DedA family protein [Bacteroidales bacterium OttesenSCG-928-K03]|nr:DedA family protein [Bacteroidales bacterium OttesenSCG-928-K22]MDL2242562.1 DedA family protein [Bacteroidales bacterium OttesenSCG-928-K03]